MKWSPPGPPFCEQVKSVTCVFTKWNTCEKTIVLYALLRMIPPVQAKFLSQALQHSLQSTDFLDNTETNANSPVFIKRLLKTRTTEVAIEQLLSHLPLLRPGNVDCKECYLMAIPELVTTCVATGENTDKIQQLLSYTLIHPAIASQDRRALTQWLRQIEERITGTPVDESAGPLPTRWDYICQPQQQQQQQQQQAQAHQQQAQQQQQQQQQQGKINNSYNLPSTSTFLVQYPSPAGRHRRSNSLTPPIAPSHHHEIAEKSNNLNNTTRQKPRSYSVSVDNQSATSLGRQSPPSSCASSGSEGRLDAPSNQNFTSNIGNMLVWLKSLRLHKYSYLFTTMCYEDMLNLTEDQLADKGVTQGARHKLALSIQKLHERYSSLLNLEKKLNEKSIDELDFYGFNQETVTLYITVLDELHSILSTPIYRSKDDDSQDRPEQDIPTKFIQVLCKFCSKLSQETPDEQIMFSCFNVLEKVLQHECFTSEQKELVKPWHSRFGTPRIMQKMQHGNLNYAKKYSVPSHSRKSNSHMNIGLLHNNYQQQQNNHMVNHQNFMQQYGQGNHLHGFPQGIINASYSTAKRSSLQENRIEHQQRPLHRTNSEPPDHFVNQSSGCSSMDQTDPEINSRLESLCLRMTEQAIGGFGEI